jgi:hypothetical protein
MNWIKKNLEPVQDFGFDRINLSLLCLYGAYQGGGFWESSWL